MCVFFLAVALMTVSQAGDHSGLQWSNAEKPLARPSSCHSEFVLQRRHSRGFSTYGEGANIVMLGLKEGQGLLHHWDNDRLHFTALLLWLGLRFVLLVHSSCCKLDYFSLASGIHCSWKFYCHEKSFATKWSHPGSTYPPVILLVLCDIALFHQLWRLPWSTPGLS